MTNFELHPGCIEWAVDSGYAYNVPNKVWIHADELPICVNRGAFEDLQELPGSLVDFAQTDEELYACWKDVSGYYTGQSDDESDSDIDSDSDSGSADHTIYIPIMDMPTHCVDCGDRFILEEGSWKDPCNCDCGKVVCADCCHFPWGDEMCAECCHIYGTCGGRVGDVVDESENEESENEGETESENNSAVLDGIRNCEYEV
jgi:hypothetical protein